MAKAVPALGSTETTSEVLPDRIGDYAILDLLGEGGMGRVFLARRIGVEQATPVALKLLRQDRIRPALVSRFEQEVELLAALDHPGVCRFHYADRLPDGSPYVVMEAVRGRPFLDYCAGLSLTVSQRLRLFLEVLEAVAYAHERLIIHRDIKSSNVLVDARGQPKLLDFGIGRQLGSGCESTHTAERFFTPASCAPEQLLGGPQGVSVDVYALGLLLHELLCGRVAFDFTGLRASEIEQRILHAPPPLMSLQAPASRATALRGDLDAIVSTCLRKQPSERYPNVRELQADIQRVLDSRPVRARPTGLAYRARLAWRRHRLPWTLAGVLAASMLAAASALLLQAREIERERSLAVSERDRALYAVGLLRDAFLGADPARVVGDQVTARQVLDAARPRLDSLKTTQPLLFAELAEALAELELGLFAQAEAQALAEAGLEAARRADAPQDLVGRLTLMAAQARLEAGDYTLAEEMLATLATVPVHQRPIRWWLAAARLRAINQQIDASLELLDQGEGEALARGERTGVMSEFRLQRADTLRWGGRFDESLALLGELLERESQHSDAMHPRTVLLRAQVLYAQSAAERLPVAVEAFDDLLARVSQVYGESSAMAGRIHGIAGTAHYLGRSYERAIPHLARSSRLLSAHLGPASATAMRMSLNHAMALRAAARPDEEIAAAFEALLGPVAEMDPMTPLGAYVLSNWLEYLGARGRWTEAVALLTGAEGRRASEVQREESRQDLLLRVKEALDGAGCMVSPPRNPACSELGRMRAELEYSVSAGDPVTRP